ncbi:MAG: transketolase [Clostridiales bacterium]|nr:transketolase [Clostridiales bacterium]
MTMQEKTVNAIRILSAEQISKANTGHPGICFDAAPAIYTLYADIMQYNNKNPLWENRDRFVLSAGHGSAMLYSVLHLFGFGIEKADLMHFRRFGSKTPGHPEYGVTAGVDVSTGPLGQGIANAVGLAVAEAHLAAKFNRPGFNIVDHYTYALCGDGCLEEGISYEACSFAGTQKLGKLILIYDKNNISIEGDTALTFKDDIAKRFEMQGWQVIEVKDANNLKEIKTALEKAKADITRPSVIVCNSVIGYGTPLAGTAAIHGSPLNAEQLAQTKSFYAWKEKPFDVPQEIMADCARIADTKGKAETEWKALFAAYAREYPELAAEYAAYHGDASVDLTALYKIFDGVSSEATRISGGKVINALCKAVPNLMSGSADLAPSTKTDLKGESWFSPENRSGRNIHFGIREHAMAAICNGIQLHGGLRAACSTFFTFSDYMKGAMRMSAIMNLPVMYVLTHDSIGVGEDGPTHQPIEQLAALRAMPEIKVFRPCDGKETAAAYVSALTGNQPTAIVLSRQDLPQYNTSGENALKGGYIIDDCVGVPDVLLVATGSEVGICSQAKERLAEEKIKARVISMPCTELFEAQTAAYKQSVLPSSVKARVCVEAASPLGWHAYAGDCGEIVAMPSFGLSAPFEKLYDHFGFTAQNIAEKAKNLLANIV